MILIVDDNQSDMELTQIALQATGKDVIVRTARDGKAALTMLRSGGGLPSLVLLDLNMPGMDGIEVLSEMRFDNSLRDLPVVMVTSSALEKDRSAAITAGANGYIRKHLSLDRFSKELGFILQRWMPACA